MHGKGTLPAIIAYHTENAQRADDLAHHMMRESGPTPYGTYSGFSYWNQRAGQHKRSLARAQTIAAKLA